ncbi:MAG TPA: copper resistance protein B [Rhodanobacteraceae bacterium]|nr:copper resistance protein B [Rhodanobacteraceae bacterium]
MRTNRNPRGVVPAIALGALFASSPGPAQDPMSGMDMSSMPPSEHAKAEKKTQTGKPEPATDSMSMQGMDMQHMDMRKQGSRGSMSGMEQGSVPPAPPQTTGEIEQLDVGKQIGKRPVARGLGLQSMSGDALRNMPPMQGGRAPPDARSGDYSDGNGHGPMTGMDMRDDAPLGSVLVDRLEYFDGRNDHGATLDAQASYGNDSNKLWLKAEGERSEGRLRDLRIEALWDHPISTYWDAQLGVRHDVGVGPDRSWAAFGVQGLAPYWFETEATVYVGQSGRTALRLEAEYELLLTQRLILQPRFEANLYGRDDPQRGIGSGLSDAEAGLRLRYEITRQFAPYIGVDFVHRFGNTADFSRAAGEPVSDPQLVAGLRVWF